MLTKHNITQHGTCGCARVFRCCVWKIHASIAKRCVVCCFIHKKHNMWISYNTVTLNYVYVILYVNIIWYIICMKLNDSNKPHTTRKLGNCALNYFPRNFRRLSHFGRATSTSRHHRVPTRKKKHSRE